MRFGYEITPVKLLLYYLLTIVICVLVCIPFELPFVCKLCISFVGFLCLPIVIVSTYKQKYEEARFVETSIYVSQMLSAFYINPKIIYALQSTQKVVTSAPMQEAITGAIDYIINTPFSIGDYREEGLKIVEKQYDCKRIRTLHQFLINVEIKGGEYKQTIDLLQRDRELWENRIEDFRKDEKNKKGEAVASAIFMIFMCWCIVMLSKYVGIDISHALAYQISTTLLIIAEMFLYIKINCSLKVDLLQKVTTRSYKAIMKDYHMVINYDPEKENRRSICYSIIPAILLAAGILLSRVWFIIIGGALLFYTIFDKRVGYSMTVKQLKKEIGFVYPEWLMEMALLLQCNTVRNSIRMSTDNAHPILKEALEKMITELDENPTSMDPYMNFLWPLRTKEINTSMSMLYAASSGTNGDAEERIKEIINSTIRMTDKAEKHENDDKLLGLELLFSAPAIPGTLNILVYTAIVMIQSMNMNNYM